MVFKKGMIPWSKGNDNRKTSICKTCGKEFKFYGTNSSGVYCSKICYWSDKDELKKQASKAAIILSKIKGSQNHPKLSDEELLKSWGRVKNNKSMSLREEFSKYGYKRVPPKRLLKLISKEEYKKYVNECKADPKRKRYYGRSHYQRGYESELQAKYDLEDEGYLVVRSSGSHTAFDVIAINDTHVRLVQVKRQKAKTTYGSTIKELQEVKVPAFCSVELWIWTDRKGWEKIIIKKGIHQIEEVI